MADIEPDRKLRKIIATIDDFYTFLTTLYIPESALKRPPHGGWPNITNESTAGFKKNPRVITLIKHLPYIDETDARAMITNIHYKCDVVDYSKLTPEDFSNENLLLGELCLEEWAAEGEAQRAAQEDEDDTDDDTDDPAMDDSASNVDSGVGSNTDSDTESDDFWDNGEPPILANVFTLAAGYESGGRWLLIDVVNNRIHEDMQAYDLMGPFNIQAYFEGLRSKLESLEYVPIRGEFYDNLSDIEDGPELTDEQIEGLSYHDRECAIVSRYKRIYREYGWPGKNYRKEEALAAVEKERQKQEEFAHKFRARSK